MKILVTGSAGFIGANLVLRLLDSETPINLVGLDNLNDYYDPSLKEYRLRQIEARAAARPQHEYRFFKGDLADKAFIDRLFEENRFDIVVNLAAQAGVRYSIDNPDAYIQSNMIGFYNILEACRHHPVQHLVYASSSSVYGGNKKVPFSTDDRVDNPVSLYATASYTASPPRACASSRSMGRPAGPTWRTSASPTSSSGARRSRSSITATAVATSLTSMILLKASSV